MADEPPPQGVVHDPSAALLRMLETTCQQRAEREAERDQLQRAADDYEELQQTLRELPAKVERKLLVPFGKLAFFPGSLRHTNEVMVLLGDNYFALRSAEQAAGIAARRAEYVRPQVAAAQADIDVLTTRIEQIRAYGDMQDVRPGELEIREPYFSDDDTENEPSAGNDRAGGARAHASAAGEGGSRGERDQDEDEDEDEDDDDEEEEDDDEQMLLAALGSLAPDVDATPAPPRSPRGAPRGAPRGSLLAGAAGPASGTRAVSWAETNLQQRDGGHRAGTVGAGKAGKAGKAGTGAAAVGSPSVATRPAASGAADGAGAAAAALVGDSDDDSEDDEGEETPRPSLSPLVVSPRGGDHGGGGTPAALRSSSPTG